MAYPRNVIMVALFHWRWGATIAPLSRVMNVYDTATTTTRVHIFPKVMCDGGRTAPPMVTTSQ